MIKLLNILFETIDPSEARNDMDSLKTVIDNKRNVCFLIRNTNQPSQWNKIEELIKQHGLKSMYVKGNPGDAYVVYRPGSENQATKLKDIAEKYGGYLSAKASETDTRKIGELLEYDPEEVEKFVNKISSNVSLKEAKQVGVIYHFTDYESALKIIQDNYVLKNIKPDADNEMYVSFTRNRDLKSPTISRNVRFTIDGDALSNRYKVEPFADVKAGFGRRSSDEAEERINVEPIGGKLDFSKYLKAIDVMKPGQIVSTDDEDETVPEFLSGYYNLIDYLKKNNIKHNVVDSYARKAI